MKLTGETIQREVSESLWAPAGRRVLLLALWETDALESPIMEGEQMRRLTKRAGDAIAFQVLGVGPLVPGELGFGVGDVVTHNSAAGDALDHTDPACPYWTVDYEDITAVRKSA